MQEFYSEHYSIADKFEYLVKYYQKRNKHWYDSLAYGNVHPKNLIRHSLTIEEAMICIEFVDCEELLTFLTETIDYIENFESTTNIIYIGLRIVLHYSQINKFALTCAKNLKSDCKPIDTSDLISSISHLKNKYGEHLYLMTESLRMLKNALIMCLEYVEKYEKMRTERQKMNILVIRENIEMTPTDTNVNRVLECNDLVRFMCEYV